VDCRTATTVRLNNNGEEPHDLTHVHAIFQHLTAFSYHCRAGARGWTRCPPPIPGYGALPLYCALCRCALLWFNTLRRVPLPRVPADCTDCRWTTPALKRWDAFAFTAGRTFHAHPAYPAYPAYMLTHILPPPYCYTLLPPVFFHRLFPLPSGRPRRQGMCRHGAVPRKEATSRQACFARTAYASPRRAMVAGAKQTRRSAALRRHGLGAPVDGLVPRAAAAQHTLQPPSTSTSTAWVPQTGCLLPGAVHC